jgi:hypothetical protein
MASAEADDERHAAIVPDRLGRNVRRNKESRGLPRRHRNGNRVHPGGPSASGRPFRSDRVGWSCRQFPGWALRAPVGVAGQAGWALADRRALAA